MLESEVFFVARESRDFAGVGERKVKEVARIIDRCSVRNDRSMDFPSFQSFPVDPPEPRVVKDILGTTIHVSEALGTIWVEERLDKITG